MSFNQNSVKVELKDNYYEVIVRKGILKDCGQLISQLNVGKKCALISDSNVAPLYASQVTESLKKIK